MMWHGRGLLPFLSALDDDAPRDGWTKWGYGAVVPLLLSLYSSSIFLTGCVTIVGRRYGTYQMHGTPAYCLAGAAVGFALLLHCRNFWSNTRRMAPWSELGVLLFLIATVACLLGFVATGFSLF